MGPGFFGDLFDFDYDGELDSFERAMDFMAFEDVMSEDDEDDCDEDDWDDDWDEDDWDDDDWD